MSKSCVSPARNRALRAKFSPERTIRGELVRSGKARRAFWLGWLTAWASMLAALALVTAMRAHAPWKHTRAQLASVTFAPWTHYTRYLRAEIQDERGERCLRAAKFRPRLAENIAPWNRKARALRYRTMRANTLELASRCLPWWIERQIEVATLIARQSARDPWPNCPDPFDGSGASWWDTVRCENSGNWLDSPGYYRCGLQFDPLWERRYGRLCP